MALAGVGGREELRWEQGLVGGGPQTPCFQLGTTGAHRPFPGPQAELAVTALNQTPGRRVTDGLSQLPACIILCCPQRRGRGWSSRSPSPRSPVSSRPARRQDSCSLSSSL